MINTGYVQVTRKPKWVRHIETKLSLRLRVDILTFHGQHTLCPSTVNKEEHSENTATG
jgi:hypothetical protein